MSTPNVNQLNWTDAQWNEYHKRCVNVGLDYLDLLATATELLVSGARLSKDERKRWERTASHVREIVNSECARLENAQEAS